MRTAWPPCRKSSRRERQRRRPSWSSRSERGRHPLLCVRPRVPDPRGRARRLQGALQRGRAAARAVGLRRRRAVRSDREEAVLPRLPGRARLQLRHARLRPALRLLPELGDVAGAARSAGRRAAASTRRRRRSSTTRCGSARASWSAPTTSRSSRASGRSRSSRRRAQPGSMTGFVSNGNGTPRVLEYLRPWIDLYKVDLKSFDDRHYRQLGGRLQPILDTIRWLHAHGRLARDRHAADSRLQRQRRRADAADGVPRRASRPTSPGTSRRSTSDYKMTDPANTTPAMLLRAAAIGPRRRPALRLRRQPARDGSATWSTRAAARCGERLVARYGYLIRGLQRHAGRRAAPAAATPIPGRWSRAFDRANAASRFPLHRICRRCYNRQRASAPRQLRAGRCGTSGSRSPTAATCAAATACPSRSTCGCRARTSCSSRRSSGWSTSSSALGVDKVRLTGGEPLLRRDLADAGRSVLAAQPGIRDLAMTTNGVLLAEQARPLQRRRPAPR